MLLVNSQLLSFQLIEFKMSWIKESAKAGITGLTPWQVVRKALMNPRFQQLPDPLEPLIKELNVSTLCDISRIRTAVKITQTTWTVGD